MKKFNLICFILSLALLASSCEAGRPQMISGNVDISSSEHSSSSEISEKEEDSSEGEFPEENSSEKDEENSSESLVEKTTESSSSEQSAPVETSANLSTPPVSSTPIPVSSSQESEKTPVSSEPEKSSSKAESLPDPPSEPEESKAQENSSEADDFEEEDYQEVVSPAGEMKAVWISYLDFNSLLKGKSEGEFRTNIKIAFSKISDMGLNTVIVQVRPFSDALYSSDIFPVSHIVTGTEGVDPGFDPLKIMVDYAHSYNLRIEAWLNPYRVRNSGTNAQLATDNPAYEWLKSGSDAVIEHSGGISYNPASKEAQKLIVDGVAEIVSNYNVDGIHFDDYFYPTTDPEFDKKSYNTYLNSGGKLSLGDFRRKNVDDLVKTVYSKVKSINPKVTFGISPQGNMENNYDVQFINVDKWLSNPGYVDYICPQIYFGFKNTEYPFANTVKLWNNKIKVSGVKLYVGLAPYKIGAEDKWAGEGIHEWENSDTMLKRMVTESRKYGKYGGFFLYRYDSLFNPGANVKAQVNREIANLKSVI